MRKTPSSNAFSPHSPVARASARRWRVRAPAHSLNERSQRRTPLPTTFFRTVRVLQQRLGTLVPALALLSLTLLLAVGCSLSPQSGGTTGSGTGRALPSVTPPAPPALTQLTPGPVQSAAGSPAIAPHLNGVPAFTTDDMASYVKNHGLQTNFGDGSPTIVQNAFLSSDALGQMLNLPGSMLGLTSQASGLKGAMGRSAGQTTRPTDAKLVGLVVLQGHFVWPPATSSSPPPTSPYAYEIFDAKSGNLIIYGGLVQPPSTQPNATLTPTAPPTGGPTPTPTPVSHPQPTATPTNTPAPLCNPIVNGTGTMNVDNVYLNVDSGGSPTNPGHVAAGTHVQWSPAAGSMAPINGAQFADMGPIGATGFTNLTCAQIKGASYGAASVPAVNDEVFLVKTAGGHYAKVLVSIIPGSLGPALRWQTYS